VNDAGEAAGARRANKRASAFRTIGEVAEDLDLPAHVLRFWESKFPELKPLKRGGGRRYYRPEDIALLRRIRQCLYQDGYTIRGVQKLLREGGDTEAPKLTAVANPAHAAAEEASLFPLEPLPSAAPPRPSRPRLVQPAPLEPDRTPALRAALEEARRELIEIRALLAELTHGRG
jgi:DNA-binding transcriptional MerR regulator